MALLRNYSLQDFTKTYYIVCLLEGTNILSNFCKSSTTITLGILFLYVLCLNLLENIKLFKG